MKDYKATKVWVEEIADISEYADRRITVCKEWIQQRELDISNKEPDSTTDWELQQIEELQEQIKALEWCINQINTPFKIKK